MLRQAFSLLLPRIYPSKQKCLIHSTKVFKTPGAYEGEGKTTVHILNREKELGLMIDGFSEVGFRLNNDITILGSIVIFPRSVLSWTVGDVSEITEESLSLVSILEPKLDILVLGIGDPQRDLTFYRKIIPFSKKYKIALEVLPTDRACATFNFLNSEGRNIAGALIPPKIIQVEQDDLLKTKLRYQNLYERE